MVKVVPLSGSRKKAAPDPQPGRSQSPAASALQSPPAVDRWSESVPIVSGKLFRSIRKNNSLQCSLVREGLRQPGRGFKRSRLMWRSSWARDRFVSTRGCGPLT